MTNREFFNSIISANINDELTAFATEAVAKLDNRNAQRSAKPSKTAVANAPIKQAIVDLVNAKNTHLLAAEIGTELGITTAKASALCRQLVGEEVINTEEVKVKGRKVHAYFAK